MSKENTGKVRFIRVGGRVIPIRAKSRDNQKRAAAAAKTIAGAGTVAIAVKSAEKSLKKSYVSFNKASDFASMRKLVKRGSRKRGELIRKSAAFKIVGRRFSKTGNLKLNLGIGLGSLFAGSAVTDLFDSAVKNKTARDFSDEIGGVVSAAIGFGATAFLSKKFKIKAKTVDQLNQGLSRKGYKLASKKLKEVSSTGLFTKKRIRKKRPF